MKIDSVTKYFEKIDGWTPSISYIKTSMKNNEITDNSQFYPCGCGIKIDLQSVLYPTIKKVLCRYPDAAELGFGVRHDATCLKGKFSEHLRKRFSAEQLNTGALSDITDIVSFRGTCALELLSINDDSDQKTDAQNKLYTFLESKLCFLKRVNEGLRKRDFSPLSFGKAHSVYAGGDLFIFDFLKHSDATEEYLVANHDSIITSDSMLSYNCPISVITSLNNSMNDLFVSGAIDEISIIPVYDGKKESCDQMMSTTLAYRDFYQERGVKINLLDCGPLSGGIQIMGATVIGHTAFELPKFSGLAPNQEILITHTIGDSSFLNLHRIIHFEKNDHTDIDLVRLNILQRLATPNYLVSKILRKYLPRMGEEFDPNKHITFCTDISGPGLFVLEEAAQASGVDIFIEDIQFIDKRSLRFYRSNHTSSVNGPIAIAAMPDVLSEIKRDLQELGLRDMWRVGKVLQKSSRPIVLINPDLRSKFFSIETNKDFFSFFESYSYKED